jgi:hypothetical protein
MGMNSAQFIAAYKTAALWSSTDSEGEPLDADYGSSDFHEDTAKKLQENCEKFIKDNAADLALYAAKVESEDWPGYVWAGHDFWLTHNGHGVGFWDRNLGELGDRLTKAAQAYPEIDLYVGDDGKIHA